MMTEYYESGFIDGVNKFANYLKKHSCSYDLDNYHSFNAIDIDDLNGLADEFLNNEDWFNP